MFKIIRFITRSYSSKAEVASVSKYQVINSGNVIDDKLEDEPIEKKSVLEECTEDISHVAPFLKPTFNFAAYINKSETLQQLHSMGVNLHKLEQKIITAPKLIMGLDFQRDIQPHVQFFVDKGLSIEMVANTITKNPFILKEDIENLQVRINYLLYKKFTEEMIVRILDRNPFWLMFSTEKIDESLGYFQKNFELTGDEVRHLSTRQPKLITSKLSRVRENTFSLKEEMGFTTEELKFILLNKPNLFMKNRFKMIETFDYIHNVMKIPLDVIAKLPQVLTCRVFKVKQRHLFLQSLGKDQYDPLKPNYISILSVVANDDKEFVVNVAKSSIIAFNNFLKTL